MTRPEPKLMGIVNVTPDSFSDGGLFLDPAAAIEHGSALIAEGADLVDVGGESTRPGAEPVPAEEEIERVLPVIRGLRDRNPDAGISVDTSKAAVAGPALAAGASIVNDVTALGDPEMTRVCAEAGCGVVLMHMRGSPRTMQESPEYDDVVAEVCDYLADRAEHAVAGGVDPARIWLDPGIGFGKTVEHNLALLQRLPELAELGFPVLVGTSRKSFIGALGGHGPLGRLGGTIASCLFALERGASVLRVHDVGAVREAIEVAAAMAGADRGVSA